MLQRKRAALVVESLLRGRGYVIGLVKSYSVVLAAANIAISTFHDSKTPRQHPAFAHYTPLMLMERHGRERGR